jgi:hypothetical protein
MICPQCKLSGYEVEVQKLSTYAGKNTYLVNTDGSRHYHLFSKSGWEWNHYQDSGEVAKWDKYAS